MAGALPGTLAAVDPTVAFVELLSRPEPEVHPGVLVSSAIYADTFGNVKLSALVSHFRPIDPEGTAAAVWRSPMRE